jgi:AcrR family transcriptional regulator
MENYVMSTELTPLDHKIINVSKDLFIQKGILKTEMKEIAKIVGISRSSLYRHFSSSIEIAFYVIPDVLDYLLSYNDPVPDGLNGFEALSLSMRKSADKMCNNLNMIRLVREFDMIYGSNGSNIEPPQYYDDYYTIPHVPIKYFKQGQTDGSIRADLDAQKTSTTLVLTIMSLIEHIMLREEIYIREHGVAREFVDHALELLLSSIRV